MTGAIRWVRARLRRLRPRRIAKTVRWVAVIARSIRERRREPGLTVAVDVSPYWEPLTGVGWYLDRVLRALAGRQDLRLRIYGENMITGSGAPEPAHSLPEGTAIDRVRYAVPDDAALPPSLAIRLLVKLRPLLIAADHNQVVFAPNFYPARRFQPSLHLGASSLVATVHDLASRHLPGTVEAETLDLLSRHLHHTFRQASRIITPSKAVEEEILEADLVPPDRVVAIHHGPGQLATAAFHDLPPWVPARYGLFIGTVEPRKNLETLLSAWRLLRKRHASPPALVVCGKLGWKSEGLQEEISQAVAEGWLHHPGYVNNQDLAALLRGAVLLAFPSHYEGFGLPVVEALAAGTPVVASDIPVLREVAGDAALYASTRNVEEWERQISLLLDDPDLARRLSEAGLKRAEGFSWEESAEAHVRAFRGAAAER